MYDRKKSKSFKITTEEQNYIVTELEKLKNHRWDNDIFPYSKRLEQNEIQDRFDITERLPTEKEKNMCSIVYTFSPPIFICNKTVALYLSQQRYRTNYTQLDFRFYELDKNNIWSELAEVYSYYESSKNEE